MTAIAHENRTYSASFLVTAWQKGAIDSEHPSGVLRFEDY
jgi:hypothetical protein